MGLRQRGMRTRAGARVLVAWLAVGLTVAGWAAAADAQAARRKRELVSQLG